MRKIQWILLLLVMVLVLPVLVFAARFAVISIRVNDSVADVYTDPQFAQAVILEDTPTIAQQITCGYATIQWMTAYLGEAVTEQELMERNNGEITTVFPRNFGPELEKWLGGAYTVRTLTNISNHEVLAAIQASLEAGLPVPISLAAVDETNRPNYTLHYSAVYGLDIPNDQVYVSNVYGYEQVYTISEFLDALKFNNYTDMPFGIQMGIFWGLFNKNAIFIVEPAGSDR